MDSISMARKDSGFADVEHRGSIDKPIASKASSKRNSRCTHESRRSSRSSQRPSVSRVAGDMPRRQKPALHSYTSSVGSHRASTTEELNALYLRSCAIMRSDSTPHGIFPEISSPSNLASGRSSIRSQPTSIASDPVAGLARRPLPHDVRSKPEVPTFVSPWDSTTCQLAKPEAPPAEAVPLEVITPSTTHWLSPETRAKQYAEIERTCRGWRGFWKKATKSEKKARQTQDHLVDFYDEKDVDDCASVRRYRIDIEDDDDEKDGELEMDSNDRGEPKYKRKGWFGGAR